MLTLHCATGVLPALGFALCAAARQAARLHLLDPRVFPLPAGLPEPPLDGVLACTGHHARAGTRPAFGCALDLARPAPASNASAAAALRSSCRARLASAAVAAVDTARSEVDQAQKSCSVLAESLAAMEGIAAGGIVPVMREALEASRAQEAVRSIRCPVFFAFCLLSQPLMMTDRTFMDITRCLCGNGGSPAAWFGLRASFWPRADLGHRGATFTLSHIRPTLTEGHTLLV